MKRQRENETHIDPKRQKNTSLVESMEIIQAGVTTEAVQLISQMRTEKPGKVDEPGTALTIAAATEGNEETLERDLENLITSFNMMIYINAMNQGEIDAAHAAYIDIAPLAEKEYMANLERLAGDLHADKSDT